MASNLIVIWIVVMGFMLVLGLILTVMGWFDEDLYVAKRGLWTMAIGITWPISVFIFIGAVIRWVLIEEKERKKRLH